MHQIMVSVASLLLGSALLFFAGGLTGVLLPLRGAAEGFSNFTLGLLGTGWAVGHIVGCVTVPQIVMRAGHIRAFSVMAAIACASVLASSLFISPVAWIVLRSLAGFAFVGAAMIMESWLTERSDKTNRGVVFGTYTMINLAAITLGQFALALGEINGFEFFAIACLFYVVSLIPTAISRGAVPSPLVQVSLDLKGLWCNSPVAVVAIALNGVANGAFGTLAAVYGERIGLTVATITLFVSAPLLSGAVAQVPIGMLSDRFDRRWVIVLLGVMAILGDALFVAIDLEGITLLVLASAFVGASIYSFYPVIVAHANDHGDEGSAMQISGGLLLVFGFGLVAGPFVGGIAMNLFEAKGLFLTTMASHIGILIFALWRMTQRSAVPEEDKGTFVPVAVAVRTSTPQTIVLADSEVAKELEVDEENVDLSYKDNANISVGLDASPDEKRLQSPI